MRTAGAPTARLFVGVNATARFRIAAEDPGGQVSKFTIGVRATAATDPPPDVAHFRIADTRANGTAVEVDVVNDGTTAARNVHVFARALDAGRPLVDVASSASIVDVPAGARATFALTLAESASREVVVEAQRIDAS